MPCSDGGPSYEQIQEQRNIPAILCALLSSLEARGSLDEALIACDWAEAGVSRQWTEAWWRRHKVEDAERREREERHRDREALREATLRKLTGEEKSILGLK